MGLIMALRTCPHCNHQYSIGDHYKNTLFSSSYKRWNCSNCGKEITFNFLRRMLLSGIGGLLMASLPIYFLQLDHSTITFLHLLLFGIPAFLFVYIFDKYSKVNN